MCALLGTISISDVLSRNEGMLQYADHTLN